MTESQKQEKKVLIKEYMKSDFNDFKESKEQEHYWDIIKEWPIITQSLSQNLPLYLTYTFVIFL